MKQANTKFIEQLKFNEKGLIPAIAQDWLDGSILMLAWMNQQSLELTLQTREVHYWSRSREEIWHKGATSGCRQILKEIRTDCDTDAILLVIEQKGSGACHTGAKSCFFNTISTESSESQTSSLPPADSCTELFEIIQSRKQSPQEGSYTNRLLKKGNNEILKKIGEESVEFVMACQDKNPESISNEAADLIFHLQVAMANQEVSWREVLRVLANRRGAPRREEKVK